MQHWWAARLLQRKWRLEASNFKLRRLGRYDELIEGNKRGRASTLYRAIAVRISQRSPAIKTQSDDLSSSVMYRSLMLKIQL